MMRHCLNGMVPINMPDLPSYLVVSLQREGRFQFERSRLNFLPLLRDLFQHAANNGTVSFSLDDSALLIADYLDIYKSDHAYLQRLAHEGKLLLGPWYVKPEQFQVATESLIRNLFAARHLADDLDIPVATSVSSASNIRQLKVILRDFDVSLSAPTTVGKEVIAGLPEALRSYIIEGRFAPTPSEDNILFDEYIDPENIGRYSARINLKQLNNAIEIELLKWVEPLTAYLYLLGSDTLPSELLRHAWKMLLENQGERSLSGFSSDDVYHAVRARLTQAEQFAAQLSQEGLHSFTQHINLQPLRHKRAVGYITVINQTGLMQTSIAEVGLPEAVEPGTYLQAVDNQGHRTDGVCIDQIEGAAFQFVAKNVPPFGHKTFALYPGDSQPTVEPVDEFATSIENEFLSVTVDVEEGMLTLIDKRTGVAYEGLNRFVDGGDAGSLEAYQSPQYDTVISIPTNAPLSVQRHIDVTGQYLQYLQIFRLPQQLKPDGTGRLPLAAQFVPISIVSHLHLIPGVPRLDVSVFVSNNASDHRLQAVFPTSVVADTAYWDGSFEICERDVGRLPMPQQAFVSAFDHGSGLTIANYGLPEAVVEPQSDGTLTLALTLLRAVGISHAFTPPLEVEAAQLHDDLAYSYSIIPHAGEHLPAWYQAWAFQALPRAMFHQHVHDGVLPAEQSQIEVSHPEFVISSIKRAEAGSAVVIRGYNISSNEITVSIRINLPHREVIRGSMCEVATHDNITATVDDSYRFDVGPREIVTLLVEL